jgi:hypothetical protein
MTSAAWPLATLARWWGGGGANVCGGAANECGVGEANECGGVNEYGGEAKVCDVKWDWA